jgi:KDO2-lipid IV(A) lauroyltransferase
VRARLGYFGFRVAMGLVGALPRNVAIAMGSGLARFAAPFLRGRFAMAVRHASRLGAEDPVERALEMFAAYGRYWAETFWVRPRRRAEIESSTTLEGREWLEKAKAGGRGIILALPHMGNWEFAGPVATTVGLDLVAVAENLANEHIRGWFVDLRRRMDIDIVLATGTASVMRELETRLNSGGSVALLCDRDLRGKGVSVPFFGEETTMPAGPVALALKTGSPILPAAAYFGPKGSHRIVVHPPVELPEAANRRAALRVGTARVAAALERLIAAAPEQWHMLQPNWPSDRAVT